MSRIFILFLSSFFCFEIGISQEAPDFQYITQEGFAAQLSDHRGEVLYVSFWASWCQPCISNFKKYAPMREELETIGVTLLNVNIDNSKELWKNAMQKHNINGVHVRGTDLDGLQELYELYSIPSYEIINKKGQFVYLSDSPDRHIITEFKSWLKE